MRRACVAILLVCAWTAHADAQQFRMSMCSSPNYGFTALGNHTTAYTHTAQATGGPSGGCSVDVALTAFTSDHPACDVSVGFNGASGATVPAQGGARYLRVYYKFSTNAPVRNSGCGGGAWEGKMLITGGADSERVIEQAGQPVSGLAVKLAKNINTPISPTQAYGTAGTWQSLQWRVVTDTTTGANDGTLAYWLNTDVEGSPTASGGGWDFDVSNWGGAGAALTVQLLASVHAAGTAWTISIGCFEVSDTFDSTWNTLMTSGHGCAGGGGGGATKYRFRFRVGADPWEGVAPAPRSGVALASSDILLASVVACVPCVLLGRRRRAGRAR